MPKIFLLVLFLLPFSCAQGFSQEAQSPPTPSETTAPNSRASMQSLRTLLLQAKNEAQSLSSLSQQHETELQALLQQQEALQAQAHGLTISLNNASSLSTQLGYLIDDQAFYTRKLERTNKVLWWAAGILGAVVVTETIIIILN